MKKNEGTIDRILRFIVGIVLTLFAYISVSGVLQITIYLIAGVLIFTALSGFCLLYRFFGFSTCPTKELKNENSDN